MSSQSVAFVREEKRRSLGDLAESEVTLNLQVGCPDTPLTFWGPCWTDAVIDAANRWQDQTPAFVFLYDRLRVSRPLRNR